MLLLGLRAFTGAHTNPAHNTHDPAPSIIVNSSRHDGRDAVTAVTCRI